MAILISINKPHTDNIFSGDKGIEWRTKPLPEDLYYVYETKNKGGCGKVIGEMRIVGSKAVDTGGPLEVCLVNAGCVHPATLKKYANNGTVYANFIKDAKRYDKPKELGEFVFAKTQHYCHLQRPPQSWCYVEELNDNIVGANRGVRRKERGIMTFNKPTEWGSRFQFPENMETNFDDLQMRVTEKIFVQMVDNYETAVAEEIASAARAAGVSDVTVLNKKTILEALEKQIPKKPTFVDTRFRNHGRHVGDGVSLDKCYKCPTCLSHIFHVWDSEKYCVHCGQALDWATEPPKGE